MAQDDRQNQDNSMTTAEAGRLGGEKVRDERGPEFYSEISQGGQNRDGNDGGGSSNGGGGQSNNPGNFANDRDKASRAGEEGGRSSGNNRDES